MSPNDNIIPIQFSSNTIPQMKCPDLMSLMKMKVIVRGCTKKSSQEYIKTAIGRILSRAELLQPECSDNEGKTEQDRYQANKPIPLEIKKRATINGVSSFHISWRVGKCTNNDEGNDKIGGCEYMTVEPQELVQKRFPKLVDEFIKAEKERTKQGDAEKNRRRAFLESLQLNGQDKAGDQEREEVQDSSKLSPNKKRKKREAFFEDMVHRDAIQQRLQTNARKAAKKSGSEDVRTLLHGTRPNPEKRIIHSTSSRENITPDNRSMERLDHEASPLFCHFGSYLIPVSPIEAMPRNEFPPRRIYIHRNR
jgi:hypothetical protein